VLPRDYKTAAVKKLAVSDDDDGIVKFSVIISPYLTPNPSSYILLNVSAANGNAPSRRIKQALIPSNTGI